MKRLLLAIGLSFGLARAAEAATSLTLDQALEQALVDSPDLVSAEASARRAGLGIEDLENSRYSLTSSLTGQMVRRQSVHPGTADVFPTAASPAAVGVGSAELTVPLFTGFKMDNAILAAQHGKEAALAQLEATRKAVALDVTRAFWALARAQLVEQVQQANLDQADRTFVQARAKMRAGRQTQHDVDQAEVSVLSAKSDVLRSQGDTRQARTGLAALLALSADDLTITGIPVAMIQSSGSRPPGVVPAPEPIDASEALTRRPDVRALEQRVLSNKASEEAAKGDRWPQLAFVTSYQHGNALADSISGSRTLGTLTGLWDLRLTASYNLFDFGRVDRAILRVGLERAEAESSLEKAKRQVRLDVARASERMRTANERLALGDRAAELALQNLIWVQNRFDQGYALFIEVADARSKLAVARTQRVDALIERELATAELKLAMGLL